MNISIRHSMNWITEIRLSIPYANPTITHNERDRRKHMGSCLWSEPPSRKLHTSAIPAMIWSSSSLEIRFCAQSIVACARLPARSWSKQTYSKIKDSIRIVACRIESLHRPDSYYLICSNVPRSQETWIINMIRHRAQCSYSTNVGKKRLCIVWYFFIRPAQSYPGSVPENQTSTIWSRHRWSLKHCACTKKHEHVFIACFPTVPRQQSQ